MGLPDKILITFAVFLHICSLLIAVRIFHQSIESNRSTIKEIIPKRIIPKHMHKKV